MKYQTISLKTSFLFFAIFFCTSQHSKADCDSLINQVDYLILTGLQDSLILLCEYANIPTVITADCKNCATLDFLNQISNSHIWQFHLYI